MSQFSLRKLADGVKKYLHLSNMKNVPNDKIYN
jgi:hypothetical protein